MKWALVALVVALLAGTARAGGPAAALPLPCGLPQVETLWVDYADNGVPFRDVFARPGVVAAASGTVVPPELRAKGAQTVYFDLYLNRRVGTPSQPADPATIQARADRLFDAAVASTGCDRPLIAENELFGAQTPTPWTPTTAEYRANVLAYLQRLAERGARPFLLLSSPPFTHDVTADEWWREVAEVADIVSETYFSGPSVAKQGAVAGSRRLRATLRTRVEKLIQIGVPTNRLGIMLTFSSTPRAGGREGLRPLSKWLDVVKWQALAAKQISSELALASVWTWGWAAFNAAGADPDKPKVACAWLWTRDHSLCPPPAELDRSLDVGAALPAGVMCVLGSAKLLAGDVAAIARLTGDRDLAFSAGFQHAVLVEARRVPAGAVTHAVADVVAESFGGSRSAYARALARARVTPALARMIVADELRRLEIESGLRVRSPGPSQVRAWIETYAAARARAVSVAGRTRVVLGPPRVFALRAGTAAWIHGVRVTALGESTPLAAFPFAHAAPTARAALIAEARHAAFATWARRKQNQALSRLTCRRDQQPLPATVDLTSYGPFLALER